MNAKSKRIVHGANITPYAEGGAVLSCEGLTLSTLLGTPYHDVSLEVHQGDTFAVCGKNGSGKTALLLTLAGRMKFSKGSLRILDYRLPRQSAKAQRRVGLGLFEGLNDLPSTQKTADAVAAEFELYGRRPAKSDVASYLAEWGLDGEMSKAIGDLTSKKLVELGVALAWVGHPDIIVVDDIESELTLDQSFAILEDIKRFSKARNATVLVGVLEPELAAAADDAYYLSERS